MLLHARRLQHTSMNFNLLQDWPTFSGSNNAVKILKKEAAVDLKKLKVAFERLKTQINLWVNNLRKEKDVEYTDPRVALQPIADLVKLKKNAEGKLADPSAQFGNCGQQSRISSKSNKCRNSF